MPEFLSWSHSESAPYLVLLQSPGPLSARTAPGGNTPALRSLGEGAHLEPAPSARPEEGRVVAGGLMRGALTPWPYAPVCRQPGTGAGPYGGSAAPTPWVLQALSDGESSLLRSGTALSQVWAGSLRSQKRRHAQDAASTSKSRDGPRPGWSGCVPRSPRLHVPEPLPTGTASDQTVRSLTIPSTPPAETQPERVLAPRPVL